MFVTGITYLVSPFLKYSSLARVTYFRNFFKPSNRFGASRTLHDDMFFKVLRAPMTFFDGPVGRVLNRFSKDLGITDETLPYIAQDVLAVSHILG